MTRSRRGAARDGLLVLLTLTTGAVDASSFLHLGNVFSKLGISSRRELRRALAQPGHADLPA